MPVFQLFFKRDLREPYEDVSEYVITVVLTHLSQCVFGEYIWQRIALNFLWITFSETITQKKQAWKEFFIPEPISTQHKPFSFTVVILSPPKNHSMSGMIFREIPAIQPSWSTLSNNVIILCEASHKYCIAEITVNSVFDVCIVCASVKQRRNSACVWLCRRAEGVESEL